MHDGTPGEVAATQEERRTSKVGNPGGQEHGKEPKGTGEQYVKSTGLAADGGNFDATKPGAGKEADSMWLKASRTLGKADMIAGLLEEKGVKKADASANDTTTKTTSHDSSEDKEKVRTIDKIKNKLHIGHRDKSS